ncbi:hypothetical protein J7481_21125 [Labrenzia sp. R4_2]|uniref:hypothetical protein n=1 Tax=Labrenzia sp. R4_2 TaxID=2821107 RepID=UPI001ADBD965|nr:hypothetical protein [Labrenzia sp. R4_2]MBO9422025.1 hypothetical protein [Labrenzia sp. R4_2]
MTKQSEADNCVWMVEGHANLHTNGRAWRSAAYFENNENEPEDILKSMRQFSVGWPLPQDRFPADNYPMPGSYPAADEQSVPQIFTNGFTFLSEESAEVVSQFDLGEGALYPTRLWHSDRVTPMPGNFFYLNVASKKDTFLPEQSSGAKKLASGTWQVPRLAKNLKLKVSAAALQGPDLWFEETIMTNFFISDRLKQALDARKLSKDWMLTRCSVVVD